MDNIVKITIFLLNKKDYIRINIIKNIKKMKYEDFKYLMDNVYYDEKYFNILNNYLNESLMSVITDSSFNVRVQISVFKDSQRKKQLVNDILGRLGIEKENENENENNLPENENNLPE